MTVDQVSLPYVFILFVRWNPKILTSVRYGISIICVVASLARSRNARDFRRVSCSFRTSAGEVKNMVTSSAYAITVVFMSPSDLNALEFSFQCLD